MVFGNKVVDGALLILSVQELSNSMGLTPNNLVTFSSPHRWVI